MLLTAISLFQPPQKHLLNLCGPDMEDFGQDLFGGLQLPSFGAWHLPGFDSLCSSPPGQPHVYASKVDCEPGIFISALILPLAGAFGTS